MTAVDLHVVLLVTGSVRCRHLAISWEAHLWVRGSLEVDGVILAGCSDGGELVVHGPTRAEAVVRTNRQVGELAELHARRIAAHPEAGEADASALAPPFDTEGGFDHDRMLEVLLSHGTVLRP
ncbi:MAG: hypothetical protein R3F59_35205 [Myxococcota bacterium]